MRRGRTLWVVALIALGGTVWLAMARGHAQGEVSLPEPAEGTRVAIFAGGCFWCMEPPFDELAGVQATTVGYIGGTVPDPGYEQVARGGTGHVEGVRVIYEPQTVSYKKLLTVFWRNIDPLDGGGQFCDRGFQYTTAIFPTGPEQAEAARQSRRAIANQLGSEIATRIESASPFYVAEARHQDYYRTHPVRYRFYRLTCGRDTRLKELWGGNPKG